MVAVLVGIVLEDHELQVFWKASNNLINSFQESHIQVYHLIDHKVLMQRIARSPDLVVINTARRFDNNGAGYLQFVNLASLIHPHN